MFKVNNIYMNPNGIYSSVNATANAYRIYKNPNAKDLFIKAKKAATVEERIKLFEEMGEYEVVYEKIKKKSKNRFFQFLKGLFNVC